MAKMTAKEKEQWNKLCEYVKTDIMCYDTNQTLSSKMILRLRGMHDGKYIANKSVESLAHYPYDIILLTFKYVKPRIDWKLQENKFVDDMHRFNYVMKIVEENLNLIYNKVKKLKEEQKKVEQIEVVDIPNYNNKYIKSNNKVNDESLKEFW